MEQAFFDAVKGGNLDEVRRLVRDRPARAGARDANGVSGILIAIYNRRPEVAAWLKKG